MFLYEKDGKLNIQFGTGNIPTNAANIELAEKEIRVGGVVIPESGEIVEKAVVMNGEYFDTIQDAIDSVEEKATIILLTNIESEKCEIPADKNIVIDLNGHKITNVGAVHTIVNKGQLEVIDNTGKGEVDNITNRYAAVWNEQGATVRLLGGTYNRSLEEGDNVSTGNTYYTLVNQGTMYLENIDVKQNDGQFSSLVENGWYDGSKNTKKELATLIIKSGTYVNGKNTIKNDDFGKLVIQGGTFKNNGTGAVVLNWNECIISSGEFTASGNTTCVVATGFLNEESDKGTTTINGGKFVANNATKLVFGKSKDSKEGGTLVINAGTFDGILDFTTAPYEVTDNR